MLNEFVKKVVEGLLETRYPHLRYPSVMYAEVIRCTAGKKGYKATLRLADKAGRLRYDMAEIPDVSTERGYQPGDFVVVAMPYGEISRPYIIGKRE